MDQREALRRCSSAAALASLVSLAACLDSPRPVALVEAEHADDRPIHERIDLPSIAACGGCHGTVYDEWASSLHARAWTNTNVRQATANFTKSTCRSCHSPLAVLPSGLDLEPEYRDFNQADGVHCLSCHGLADGVAAARTLPDAPCRPRYEPRLLQAEMCWPCHQPTHQAFDEFEVSDARAVGLRCADCHMPPREGAPGRSHGPHGGLNEDFVRRAVAWQAWLEGGALKVELRNRTGHKFPGEIPSRSFVVRVDLPDAEPRTVLLRRPHKGERREDDRLLPDETRVLSFDLPAGTRPGEVEVSLLFKPLPLLPDQAAFVLGRGAPRPAR